jgi:hypothetical protein
MAGVNWGGTSPFVQPAPGAVDLVDDVEVEDDVEAAMLFAFAFSSCRNASSSSEE